MKSLNCTNVLWNVVMRETGRENPRSLACSPQKYLKGSDNKIGSLLQFFWSVFFFNSLLRAKRLDDGDLMDFTWETNLKSFKERQMVLNKHVDFFPRSFKSPFSRK